jgi:hypothetical protein
MITLSRTQSPSAYFKDDFALRVCVCSHWSGIQYLFRHSVEYHDEFFKLSILFILLKKLNFLTLAQQIFILYLTLQEEFCEGLD